MKRFVWRLQRVLDVRKKQEQVKKAELIAVTEQLTQARSELLAQKRILEEIIEAIAVKNPRERLGEQELFLRYSVTSDEQIKRLEEKVRQLEALQKEKIDELLKIRRFREGLEKLREEAKRNFMEEQERLEQRELDEMATQRFARKMAAVEREEANAGR